MNRFVAIMLSGKILVAEGETVAQALGHPAGIDFYMPVTDNVTVAMRVKFNQKHDVTVHYVYHKTIGYIIAAILPFNYDYSDFEGKVFSSKEEMIESVVKYVEDKGWKA